MTRIFLPVVICVSFVVTCAAAPASNILEKKFPFPPPIQWKSGQIEVSLIAVAWGPADSPEMVLKGHTPRLSREAPAFFPDRSYAVALKLQARAFSSPGMNMITQTGLVLVKDVGGDLESPMELTANGFVRYSGAPGTYDIQLVHETTTEFWDFFPVTPDQRQFLFQSFRFSAFPG